ncbi:MAG: 5-amino-6-(D-ribitylamino)uracil--L-tyrosine 4-hydroxyphenyl transferase CofH [Xanthobacteraceae bacterium]|nr:5-amino-6-(D-ribitylamino)uracil--L-tyrosine 4-hydroxyphenyl transferase CofH [Xanthobacteraceae bacterium]QYK45684.1 MAG: 5-amino-6-(D-ribitylamino)uracil--L-tyrosine 4-hydroxyphenyl transferase CofH [Xanthobacteraceae bacterium]
MTNAIDIQDYALEEARSLLARFETTPLEVLLEEASRQARDWHGHNISFSRKVFIPLTQLCRDTCAYCTFAKTPRHFKAAYLSSEEVLQIAKAGERAGCTEALFTLGDKPELRYAAAREELEALGYPSTHTYLEAMCDLVLKETSLLPHVNAGVMSEEEISRFRRVSVSQGIMLESISRRLCERGGAHFGSPDKDPTVRIEMIAAAGRQKVPFTSGILIGIGENRLERIQSLLALRDLHRQYGHIQEVIVQNFRAKADTRFAANSEPDLNDLLWTAAVARIVLGGAMNIQVPPNLSYSDYPKLLQAGINDWGGVSPVTVDHVNPEAAWPAIAKLRNETEKAGFSLTPRLAAYPEYIGAKWLEPEIHRRSLQLIDSNGFVREEDWAPGVLAEIPAPFISSHQSYQFDNLINRAMAGERLDEHNLTGLFSAKGAGVEEITTAANELRQRVSGDTVRYVVNRNINYTNVCIYRCSFCAFSKGKSHEHLRGKPYDISLGEVARRVREAWNRGATEVCMQGGINPHYTGQTYLDLVKAVKDEVPDMHVHAFSPLEVSQGAVTLGISVDRFLRMLRDEGLGSLPGTAAEILDDDIRQVICADKLNTQQWLSVIKTAHECGLPTTSTIMFGHVETPISWAKHLLALRDLQRETGGITEFVPLPFVHMEAPMSLRGQARKGPTWREVRLMHAISRLALHPLIPNIQASWVKVGTVGAEVLLRGGANDLGGTLMNESISRAAGTQHGQELDPQSMECLIRAAGRAPQQRTTLYAKASAAQQAKSYNAAPLSDLVLDPFVGKRKGANGNVNLEVGGKI